MLLDLPYWWRSSFTRPDGIGHKPLGLKLRDRNRTSMFRGRAPSSRSHRSAHRHPNSLDNLRSEQRRALPRLGRRALA